MREHDLRRILGKLGVDAGARKRDNGWIEFRCPLAPFTHLNRIDRRPSAAAKVHATGTSLWTCQTCHSHGRLTSLVNELQRHRHTFFPGLVTEIDEAERAALMDAPFLEPMGAFEFVAAGGPKVLIEEQYIGLYIDAWEDEKAREYLERRGIGEATAKTLGLTFDRSPGERRILFSVRGRMNELYGFSGRTIVKHIQPKVKDYAGLPKREVMLGAERWRPGRPLIIVEGLFAYAHLHAVGAERYANIGALLGSVLTPEKAELVRNFDEPVYLLLDNDAAGDVGTFGRVLADGTRDKGGAALDQLNRTFPVMVPSWPVWETSGVLSDGTRYQAGDEKTDPDQLTLDEVNEILTWTPPA
jgi:hypothetical protein